MITRMKLWAAASALIGLLTATGASAATICVNPAVATCQPTIQLGINAAAPGDKITIAPGVYFENTVVPADKDGLQIAGVSKLTTILDASPYTPGAVANAGTGMGIRARNVSVKNLTIRNGNRYGIGTVEAGTVLQGLNFIGQDQGFASIYVAGTYAYGVQIIANEFHSGGTGILTESYGTVIKGNVMTDMADYGISVLGDGAQISANRIYNAQFGIYVNADGPTITLNDVKDTRTVGIFTAGSYPTVLRNKVAGSLQDGIVSHCMPNCFGGSVSLNSVVDTSAYGLLVDSDSHGLLVQGNILLRTGRGASLNGTGIFASLNRATDVGAVPDASCFEVFGVSNVISKNTATRCAKAGVYVSGYYNYVDQNTALNTLENGFTVDGDDGLGGFFDGNSLIANKTSFDAAQGVAVINGATNTEVIGNVAANNRLDFCDDGTTTSLLGNVFGTSAATGGTDCVIAH